jgi:aminopeptidase N
VQSAPAEHPTLRSHRLALGLYGYDDQGALVRRDRLELDITGERTIVDALSGKPVPDLLLVNDGDLAFAKVRLDPRSVDTIIEGLARITDPLARALAWATAWDMVRDGELPTRRYAELVARQAPAETEVSALERCLAQALTAIDTYGAPDNRGTARRMIRDAARSALDHADPGSDHQLAWARCLVSVSDSDEDLAFVEGLLEGREKVPGLTVDTDFRWLLVGRLASAGRASEELIDEEVRRDPTDIGRRRAAAARAARPTAAAKEEAWRRVVEEQDLPLATANAIAGGFHQAGQDQLLEPYIDRFVEVLPSIWQRTPEEAVALTEGLFPRYLVDARVVAAAESALAKPQLPPPARRILLEEKDGVLRAQRARSADEAAVRVPAPAH